MRIEVAGSVLIALTVETLIPTAVTHLMGTNDASNTHPTDCLPWCHMNPFVCFHYLELLHNFIDDVINLIFAYLKTPQILINGSVCD